MKSCFDIKRSGSCGAGANDDSKWLQTTKDANEATKVAAQATKATIEATKVAVQATKAAIEATIVASQATKAAIKRCDSVVNSQVRSGNKLRKRHDTRTNKKPCYPIME